MSFSTDLQYLVEVPLVADEPGAPLTDRLMADDDTPLGEQILKVAEAEVESRVQRDGVSDDLGREAAASTGQVVGRGRSDGHHATLLADSHSS